MKRRYEIAVDENAGGYEWRIEVEGETIAMSHGLRLGSPREAHCSARQWARRHEELGYDFRANWWEPA
jgi:hypothetical protein